VACVSPADENEEETLCTLKYANRARNILNKPTVNRDAASAEVAYLRQQLHAARAALMQQRNGNGSVVASAAAEANGGDAGGGGGDGGHADMAQQLTVLEARVFAAEAEAKELHVALEDSLTAQETAKAAEMTARVDRDKLQLRLERATARVIQRVGATDEMKGGEKEAVEEEVEKEEDEGLVEGYLRTIHALESETQRLRAHIRALTGPTEIPGDGLGGLVGSGLMADGATGEDEEGECEDGEGEGGDPGVMGYTAVDDDATAEARQALGSELEALERNLRAKEEYMRKMASGGHQMVALKQHYDAKVGQMETEIERIQREKLELCTKLTALQESKGDSKQIGQYRSKLKALEAKLGTLQKKVAANARLERLKTQSEEAAKRLTVDIQGMKRARVEMLKKMERLSKEAAEHRRAQEKALLQATRSQRQATVQLQKATDKNVKQAAVVKRKTEEVQAVQRRLADMTERKQAAASMRESKPHSKQPNRVDTGQGRPPSTPGAAKRVPFKRKAYDPEATAAPGTPGGHLPLDRRARKAWVDSELASAVQLARVRHELSAAFEARASANRELRRVAGEGPRTSQP